jgi:hypothetical protein
MLPGIRRPRANVGLLANIAIAVFPLAGKYDFRLTVDGEPLATVPLYVDVVERTGQS